MSECKQAQSHEQQIAELKDSRLPKTEREHAAAREIERLEQRLAAAEAKIPDKPLGVFSEGVWVFATTAQTFTAEDLDIAAFVKYRDHMKGGE